LCALGKPFVYFPIDGHYEQELVAARLCRHGLGRRMSLRETTPEMLAESIGSLYGQTVAGSALPVDGAAKAARHILGTVDRLQADVRARRSA
jgi:UDP:flavonoid glycosyltransferase YjiC (YdhE family)